MVTSCEVKAMQTIYSGSQALIMAKQASDMVDSARGKKKLCG
jgi:hypothetical protein